MCYSMPLAAFVAVALTATGAPLTATGAPLTATGAQRGALPAVPISAPDFATLSKTFHSLARRILEGAPEADRPGSRLRLAISALAAAEARPLDDRPDAINLIEQACDLLRDVRVGSPDVLAFSSAGGAIDGELNGYFDVERQWHRAAMAVLEGWVAPVAMETHLRHALDRFPDDPHLRLSRGVVAEWAEVPPVRLGDPGDVGNPTRFRRVIGRFQDAQEYEDVRVEATVRLGYTLLRVNRSREALDELDAALRQTDDPYLRYLALLFRGQALDHLERFGDAADAYRAATEAVPGAQTAALALAVALTRSGRYEEASRVASAATRDSSTDDPFFWYWRGGYRWWPALIRRLQEAVQ